MDPAPNVVQSSWNGRTLKSRSVKLSCSLLSHCRPCQNPCVRLKISSAENTRGRSGAQRSYAREVFSGEEIFNRAKGAPRERRACVSARTERSWHGRQCLALWELLLFLSWLQPEVSRKLEPTFTAVQRGVHAASRGPRIPGAMPWLKLTSHKFA